jgi:hypothetical protein
VPLVNVPLAPPLLPKEELPPVQLLKVPLAVP